MEVCTDGDLGSHAARGLDPQKPSWPQIFLPREPCDAVGTQSSTLLSSPPLPLPPQRSPVTARPRLCVPHRQVQSSCWHWMTHIKPHDYDPIRGLGSGGRGRGPLKTAGQITSTSHTSPCTRIVAWGEPCAPTFHGPLHWVPAHCLLSSQLLLGPLHGLLAHPHPQTLGPGEGLGRVSM